MKRAPAVLMRLARTSRHACWEWQGARNGDGYGLFRLRGVVTYVHRFMYATCVGPIPAGHEVHHTCENRACANPTHLQAVEPSPHRSWHGRRSARRRQGKRVTKRGRIAA